MWNNIVAPINLSKKEISILAQTKNKVTLMKNALSEKQIRDSTVYRDSERSRNSLSLEGTHLSEDDMTTIYNGGLPKHVRSQDSLKEALNMKSAIDVMYDMLDEKVKFSEDVLLRLHGILSNGLLDYHNSGSYRNCQVSIGDGNYQVAAINQAPKLMKQLFEELEKINNPVLKATFFSYTLVSIHPFKDFNGRLSRLCESYILLENEYPPISITMEDRTDYINLIKTAQQGEDRSNLEYMIWVAKKVIDTVDSMLSSNPEYDKNSITGF